MFQWNVTLLARPLGLIESRSVVKLRSVLIVRLSKTELTAGLN